MENNGNLCTWCQNHDKDTPDHFTVIDTETRLVVLKEFILFCPFCGRKMETDLRLKIGIDSLSPTQKEMIGLVAECSMNLSEVARRANVARTHVGYHVRKIAEKTDKDPLNFYDLQELLDGLRGNDDGY